MAIHTIEDSFKQLYRKRVAVVFDHARAGNGFFMRIFDMHPEVLSIPLVGYFFSNIVRLFADRETIPGIQAYNMVLNETNFSAIGLEINPDIAEDIERQGDTPGININRKLAREALTLLLKEKDRVSRRDVITAAHLAYALAIRRDIGRIKYILINDATRDDEISGVNNRRVFDIIRKDYPELKIIHLVRDPRANFASLRHQYVNQFGNMYPVRNIALLWRTVRCNCLWLWILRYTSNGAKALALFQKYFDESSFYVVRNEDINLKFKETLQRLTAWLGVEWFDKWSEPGYVPTSGGVPWKGVSAYSNSFQKFTDGPLKNDLPGKDLFPGPNQQVTQRWRKRLYRREIKFLESVYFDEMRKFDYKSLYVKRHKERILALLWILLPLSGELPRIGWWLNGKRIKNKMAFLSVLPISYILSRALFIIMYHSGTFDLSDEERRL